MASRPLERGSQIWADPDARVAMSDPAVSLQMYGSLVSQEDGQTTRYDPYAITNRLQSTILSYVSKPPLTAHGQVRWLVALASRQSGKSLCGELAFYPKAAYNPGWDHVAIADKHDRADYLHERLQFNHSRWPEEYRTAQLVTNETRQLTFVHGGKMRVLSGWSEDAGIGQSVDSLHGSELPFWKNAAKAFSMLNPAMLNRNHAYMLLESTPAPLSFPSAPWWKDKCMDAKQGRGRLIYAFFPFWDGKLNARPWPVGQVPTNEELRLLERYGPKGLTLDNLEFRRFTMDNDGEVRRNPDLFDVYWPFDDVSCWLDSTWSVIPSHALDRHKKGDIRKWSEPYTEFLEPNPDAVYLLAADPAGYGRDHSAFHVFEVWADEWKQAAAFGGNVDPDDFGEAMIRAAERYNMAMIACERNGVGVGAITYLKAKGYKRIWYDASNKPGVHKSSHDEMMAHLIDALMDKFTLHDEDTIMQLGSYRADKLVETSVKASVLNRDWEREGRSGNRRQRHHWDKVSALAVAAKVCRSMPVRHKPMAQQGNVVLFPGMTHDQWEEYIRGGKAKKPGRGYIVRRHRHKK